VVRKHAHAGEIQLLSQSPNDPRRNVPEGVPGSVICEYNAEEDGPLAAPVLTDFVTNPHHVRPDGLLDSIDGRLDFGLLRYGWGKEHPDLILQRCQGEVFGTTRWQYTLKGATQMFTAYYDESGTPDQYAVIVAGFVSTANKWGRFERDWKHLHADFGLPDPHKHPFHMKDFAHSKHAFESWEGDTEKRRQFIDRLVSVIRTRVEVGFTFGVEMDVYRSVNALFTLKEKAVAPYALCASGCMNRANSWAKKKGALINHVFADGAIDKGRFLQFTDPTHPTFGTMAQHLPCQAADFSAYEALKFRKDFDAYNTGLKRVRVSLAALYKTVKGEHLLADEASLIDLCERLGLPRRDGQRVPQPF
jgi:hypothetical protein